MTEWDWDGSVAVVTGAASGIGRALAEQLARRGCRLMLADVEAPALASAVLELSESHPGVEVASHVTDVSVGAEVDALASSTLERFGRVDVVCNNAGVGSAAPIWELTEADWNWVLGVNLWGVIHGIRAFVPHLIAQGHGHIVNTASMAGLLAPPGMAPYVASKHAVVGLSESLYGELRGAGHHVGVTVICPGWVNTRIYQSDRNRPEGVPSRDAADPETQAAINELAAAFFESAMSAETVATLAIEAVEAGRFWVLTHPEMSPAITARFDAAVHGENPSLGNPFQ